jgi:hypothetical protein
MKLLVTLLALICAGCANIEPMSISGKNLSYEHGTGNFQGAYADAINQCKKQGLSAKATGTSCPWRCVTNFVCE